MFARSWQVVAAADQLAEPGRHVATELAGWPIVVVRDADGVLRAFHNVCRHRGGPLVDDGEGAGARFVCRYHGWAYALDGTLVNARDFRAADLDVEALALHEVAVGGWRGLVFVHLASDPEPLEQALGPLAELAAAFPMEDLRFSHELHHELDADWMRTRAISASPRRTTPSEPTASASFVPASM